MMQQLDELQNLQKSIMNRRVIEKNLRKEKYIEKIQPKTKRRRPSSVKRSLGLSTPILIAPAKPQTTLFEKKPLKLLEVTPSTSSSTSTATPSDTVITESSYYADDDETEDEDEETSPSSYTTLPSLYESEPASPSYTAESEEEDMNESNR